MDKNIPILVSDSESNDYPIIESDPRYSEVEFTLAEFDSHTDPLGNEDSAGEINWYHVASQAQALLDEYPDLRVSLWLLRAQLRLQGISALYFSLKFIDDFLLVQQQKSLVAETQTENSSAEDDAAALSWLSTSLCLSELKQCRLCAEQSVTLDTLLSQRDSAATSGVLFSDVMMAIGKSERYFQQQQWPALSEQISYSLAALLRIEEYVNKISRGYRLDCRPVIDYLTSLQGYFATQAQQSHGENNASVVSHAHQEPEGEWPDNQNAGNLPQSIRSRQDVVLLLDQILDYFQQYEPSHPAPIFIRRTQKMIGMDFATIVEELLPESINTLQQYSGR